MICNTVLSGMTINNLFLLSELIVRWATDVYEFTESQIATVELVTDSKFEVSQVSIQGYPRQIPDEHPNRFASLVVPGPAFSGKKDFKYVTGMARSVSPTLLS